MSQAIDKQVEDNASIDGGAVGGVVFDESTVLSDALNYTPWGDEGGHLPQRGEWSTLRGASKDIILWVTTFMFNQTRRRLDIKSYFVGEHPIFKELEPTRALLIVLMCQGWQSGRSLELSFEGCIPIDVRELIERRIVKVISGHETILAEDITEPLFAELSGFTPGEREEIKKQVPQLSQVCFNIYRGVWSTSHVKTFLARGVPLRWLFIKSPGPVTSAHNYWYLVQQLRAVLLEDYVVKRLADRPLGETLGNTICQEGKSVSRYISRVNLTFNTADANACIPVNEPFRIIPILPIGVQSTKDTLQEAIQRVNKCKPDCLTLLGLPLDVSYMKQEEWLFCKKLMADAKCLWVVIGLTLAQIKSEISQKLAMTTEEYDYDAIDSNNADRHTD